MLAHWDQVVARQPGNADAWNNRGVALREPGRLLFSARPERNVAPPGKARPQNKRLGIA
jgi:hypothetical protein